MSLTAPSQHPAWPRLTADQRKAVNEVWNDMVVPAFEEAERLKAQAVAIRLEAQDIRDGARAGNGRR